MVNYDNWACIYSSDSLIEANLIRAYLESRQIPVAIYSIPTAQLHDYLHDKQEQIRIFVQSTQLQQIKESIQRIVQSNRREYSDTEAVQEPLNVVKN